MPARALFPFAGRNQKWAVIGLQVYLGASALALLLGGLLWAAEGGVWQTAGLGLVDADGATGGSALGALWFGWLTLHGVSFGHLIPLTVAGRVLTLLLLLLGYLVRDVFALAVALLSQLAAEEEPALRPVLQRLLAAAWPSLPLFLLAAGILGALARAAGLTDDSLSELSEAGGSTSALLGPYYGWCVALRSPFGDLLPTSPGSRVLTGLLGVLGVFYPPYLLALVALRRLSPERYVALRTALQGDYFDVSLLGPGLLMPESQHVRPASPENQMVGSSNLNEP